jgi:benzoyl-CoA reductase subunit C
VTPPLTYNENRRALRDLYAARSRTPWVFPAAELYQVVRAGNVMPPEAHTPLIRDYLREAPLDPERRDVDRSRVVLVGTFCEQPPLGLLLTLERAGCWIVDDDLLLGLRWLTSDVPTDPQALATPF